jgi:Cu-processing system permease protein
MISFPGSKEAAIGWVSLLEAVRRKDIYVMLILSGIIIVVTGIFNAFGIPELDKFMVDVSLSIINVFVVILAVLISARQLPYELERRTLYPMLAKPISRLQFLLGKFAGIMAMATIALLLFFIVAAITFMGFGISIRPVYFQHVYLRWVSLFLICSMTLCLSLFLTHAANVTVSLLICMGASMFTRTIVIVHDNLNPLYQNLVNAIYWIFPHLDLFDLSRRVTHGWPAVAGWALAALTLYGLIYTTIFLWIGYLRFRRLPL